MDNAEAAEKPTTWAILKQALANFGEDDAMTLGAALAYYAALSLAPLVVLALWVSSFTGEGAQQALVNQIVQVMGEQAGAGIRGIISAAKGQPTAGSLAGIISLCVLAVSASGVFGQLQHSFNVVWHVKAKPGLGIWGFLRKRLVAVAVVGLLMVTLVGSMMISTGLAAATKVLGGHEGALAWVWEGVNLAVVTGLLTLLLAVLFKFVPDVRVQWRDVWVGAVVTAVLFTLAKFGIGVYLGRSGTTSAYGAAGSLMALLIWVYYSALVLFLGAELTQAWAAAHGRAIEPDEHAVAVVTGERAIGSSRSAGREERGRPEGEAGALPREKDRRAWKAGRVGRGTGDETGGA
jgi:membrane protein